MTTQPESALHSLDLSIIVPVFNEENSLKPLCGWIHEILAQLDLSAEIVFVDDA